MNIIRATGPTTTLSAIAYICIDYAAESFLRQRNLSNRTFMFEIQNQSLKKILPIILKIESETSVSGKTTYEIESYTLRNTASFLVALCISSYLSVAFLKQGKLKTAGISAAPVVSLQNFLARDGEMTLSVATTHFRIT